MPLDLPFVKKDFSAIVADLLEDVASGRGGRTALTDANDGSVVRTLIEVFAREMAVCYGQLDIVYRNAYLDTASGAALDNVVALQALSRYRAGHLEGTVTFSSSLPAANDVHIPAGTLVAGRGVPQCATTAAAVLAQGERLVSVGVLSLEPPMGGVQVVKAGAISTLPRPIAGIDKVVNSNDLILRQRQETDEELRSRVRNLALSAHTGTVSALEQAVRSLGLSQVQVLEYPRDPLLLRGQIHVVVGDPEVSAELMAQVAQQIEEVRPAGIAVSCGPATQVWVQVTATLILNADKPDRDKLRIQDKLNADLKAYFDQLGVGETVRQSKIRSLLTGDDAVVDCDLTQGFSFILEPFVRKDGQLQSQASQYLRTSGDVQIGPRDRVGLLPQELPLHLSMEGPAPALSLDVDLELAAGGDATGLKDKVTVAFGHVIDEALKSAGGKDGSIAFDPFKEQVDAILKPAKATRLRISVVHESDGRVMELAMAGAMDSFSRRETPRLRNLNVSVSK